MHKVQKIKIRNHFLIKIKSHLILTYLPQVLQIFNVSGKAIYFIFIHNWPSNGEHKLRLSRDQWSHKVNLNKYHSFSNSCIL